MDMKRIAKNTYPARFLPSAFLCLLLHTTPAHAVWEYSLAAQLAFHDGARSTCEKVEPRINAVLNNEWAQLVHANGMKAINTARKSQEYSSVYLMVLHAYLKSSWGDAEEEAHMCEEVFLQLKNSRDDVTPWWRDRVCAGVSLDSEDGTHCGKGPHSLVSFNVMTEGRDISILRIVPSSDVSFPEASRYSYRHGSSTRVVSTNYLPGAWAIPDSVEFEWKEWPQRFPEEPKNNSDLINIRSYAGEVRAQVPRKRKQILLRDQIPDQVITDVLQSEREAKPGQEAGKRIKLFFIFMQSGLQLRWEQWHGECIEKYGGDNIDLPLDQLLSTDYICDEPRKKP